MEFPQLEYNPRRGDFEGEIALAAFDDCGIAWRISPHGIRRITETRPDPKRTPRLTVTASETGRLRPSQQAALEYLLANQEQIARNVLEHIADRLPVFSRHFPDPTTLSPKSLETLQRFSTVEGLKELVDLMGVHVLSEKHDGVAQTEFTFRAAFDDHDLEVLVQRDEALSLRVSGRRRRGRPKQGRLASRPGSVARRWSRGY